VSNHAIDGKPYKQPHFATPNFLFRNLGGGKFVDVSANSGVCPPNFPTRSVAVFDFEGDGLLDLLVGECFFQGGQSRTRLFRNLAPFVPKSLTLHRHQDHSRLAHCCILLLLGIRITAERHLCLPP